MQYMKEKELLKVMFFTLIQCYSFNNHSILIFGYCIFLKYYLS